MGGGNVVSDFAFGRGNITKDFGWTSNSYSSNIKKGADALGVTKDEYGGYAGDLNGTAKMLGGHALRQ